MLPAQEVTRICTACGNKSVYVIESRTADVQACPEPHKRRRLKCRNCGARSTTREISDELFHSLLKRSAALTKAATSIGFVEIEPLPTGQQQLPCRSCKHNTSSRCGLDIPEYMTVESADCNIFEPCK